MKTFIVAVRLRDGEKQIYAVEAENHEQAVLAVKEGTNAVKTALVRVK